MARPNEVGIRPLIRSVIRQGVRGGQTPDAIRSELTLRYETEDGRIGGLADSVITRMINQERGRNEVVNRLFSQIRDEGLRAKRNIHALVGCGAGERVQAGVAIRFYEAVQERYVNYYVTVPVTVTQGRGQDVLNAILRSAIDAAMRDNYHPGSITSSMTSGRTGYTLNYLECVT